MTRKAEGEARGINRNAARSTAAALRGYRNLGVTAVEWLASDDACPA